MEEISKYVFFNKSGVVYQINCLHCNQIYIGQTCCKLKNRISKHKSDVNTKKIDASELAGHSLSLKHVFDFENTRILEIEPKVRERFGQDQERLI